MFNPTQVALRPWSNMRIRARIEEGAPGLVLFALAATVVMITSGIVYVLFDNGSKFYRGFACGADDFKPPQDWDEDLKASIKDAANYSDGSISDPLWLNSLCITEFDMEHEVVLADPLIDRFQWDVDSKSYPEGDDRQPSVFTLEDGTEIRGPQIDEGRSYLTEYFSANPEKWDPEYPKVPLGVISANEKALILHTQNPDLAREWWVTIWVGDDDVRMDMENFSLGLNEYSMGSVYKEGDFVRVELDTYCGLEDGNQQTLDTLLSDASIETVDGCFTLENHLYPDIHAQASADGLDVATEYLAYKANGFHKPEIGEELGNGSTAWSIVGEKDLPYDYDQDGVWNTKSDGQGGLADNDIDGDGIANKVDHDMDNDGIPNAFDSDPVLPNVDWVGILLGVLTLAVVVVAYASPQWLPKLSIETIDATIPTLKSVAYLVVLIGFMSLISPPSGILLMTLLALMIILTILIRRIDGGYPKPLIAIGLTSLFFALFSIHEIQTGHTIFFGGSMIFMANIISDTRNQAGLERTAIMEGDSRSLMILIVLVTLMLCYFDFVARVNGSLGEFLTQTWWKTDVRTVSVVTVGEDLHMGVNSLLQTTLQVALGALVIAIPIGLGTAIYLSEYASQRTANFVKPVLELLAGIPSVVYGFFAFVVIAPIVVDVGTYFLERGWIAEEPQLFNPLSGAIVVGIMITPLIASLSEDALRAVPDNLRQASYALGATPVETTARVTVPSALSGILASIILALSRAIGETMAVTLSVGTLATFSNNMFRSAQTMTAYIAQRIGGELPIGTTPYYSLFAVGFYLFFITLGLNLIGHRIMTRFREAYD